MSDVSPEIHAAPQQFKSHVWKNFGFHNLRGKNELDMSNAVCKLCHGKIKYCGNTTNIRAHITRHHPELSDKTAEEAKPASSKQQTLDTCFSKLPSSSEKANRITESISHFICKDLRPYSVVENTAFRNMIYTLEPRYTIPSRRFFSDTALPEIYNDTQALALHSLHANNSEA